MSDLHNAQTAQSTTETPANGTPTLRDRVKTLRLPTPDKSARPSRGQMLPWGLAIIGFAVALFLAWRSNRAASSAPPPTATIAVSASASDVSLDAKGYVVAAHQIQLSPQVGGELILVDKNFREGAIYHKGDRLAEIDPILYQAQVKSAEAALHVAEVNLEQAMTGSMLQEIRASKAQLENMAARLELARVDERNKRRAGVATSRDDMEKASLQSVVDQAAHDAQRETVAKLETALKEQQRIAQFQVISARAALEQAQKQLKNCTIVAPTDGIILSKKAEEGGYVNPLAFGATGYLCEMADLKNLEVEIDIQERDIARVHTGQRCRIMPEAGQHDDEFLKTHKDGYTGVMSRRMPMALRNKGAVTVRVKINIPADEKSGEFLLPDMGVLVSFLKSETGAGK